MYLGQNFVKPEPGQTNENMFSAPHCMWTFSKLFMSEDNLGEKNTAGRCSRPIFARLSSDGDSVDSDTVSDTSMFSPCTNMRKIDFNIGVSTSDPQSSFGACNMEKDQIYRCGSKMYEQKRNYSEPVRKSVAVPGISFAAVLKKPPFNANQSYDKTNYTAHKPKTSRDFKMYEATQQEYPNKTHNTHTQSDAEKRFGGFQKGLELQYPQDDFRFNQMSSALSKNDDQPTLYRDKLASNMKQNLSLGKSAKIPTMQSEGAMHKFDVNDRHQTFDVFPSKSKHSSEEFKISKTLGSSWPHAVKNSFASVSDRKQRIGGNFSTTAQVAGKKWASQKPKRSKRENSRHWNFQKRNGNHSAEVQASPKDDSFTGRSHKGVKNWREHFLVENQMPDSRRSYANVVTSARTGTCNPGGLLKKIQDSKFDFDKLDGVCRAAQKKPVAQKRHNDFERSGKNTSVYSARALSVANKQSTTKTVDTEYVFQKPIPILLQRSKGPVLHTNRNNSTGTAVPVSGLKRDVKVAETGLKESSKYDYNSKPFADILKDQLKTKPKTVAAQQEPPLISEKRVNYSEVCSTAGKTKLVTQGTQTNISQVADCPLFVHVACKPLRRKKPSAKKQWQGELRQLQYAVTTEDNSPSAQNAEQKNLQRCEAAVQCDLVHDKNESSSCVQHYPVSKTTSVSIVMSSSPVLRTNTGRNVTTSNGNNSVKFKTNCFEQDTVHAEDSTENKSETVHNTDEESDDFIQFEQSSAKPKAHYVNPVINFILSAAVNDEETDSDFEEDWSSDDETSGSNWDYTCEFQTSPLVQGVIFIGGTSPSLKKSISMPTLHSTQGNDSNKMSATSLIDVRQQTSAKLKHAKFGKKVDKHS